MKWNVFFHKRRAASLTLEDVNQCGCLILDGMGCLPVQPHEVSYLSMAWNLKPIQWAQPLTGQVHPMRSRAGGRRW